MKTPRTGDTVTEFTHDLPTGPAIPDVTTAAGEEPCERIDGEKDCLYRLDPNPCGPCVRYRDAIRDALDRKPFDICLKCRTRMQEKERQPAVIRPGSDLVYYVCQSCGRDRYAFQKRAK